MSILLKSVTIVCPGSPLNGKTRDLLIERGKLKEIGTRITDSKARVIQEKGLCVSPGWFDTCAFLGDPGFEHKENLHSGLDAAAHGGFTALMTMPLTKPVADSKSGIEYVLNRSANHVVNVVPSGTLSEGAEGRQLAELLDMRDAGARTFTDYKRPVNTPELMSRALEYARNFDGIISVFPHDNMLGPGGVWHEGQTSVSHGVKGIPSLAEEMRLQRDIELLRYQNSSMHVLMISTAASVELVRKAKKDGLNLTCGVAAHNLFFNDSDINGFDTDRKVLPPFRSKADVKALIKGLKDGTIDMICSDHTPQDVESKRCEFEHAEFGVSNLETAFAAAITATGNNLSLDEIIACFATNPRKRFGLSTPLFEEGEHVDYTVFNPETTTTIDRNALVSKGKNTPFHGKELKGSVRAVFCGMRQMEF
ncbi:MAG: dihydroorotase [Flavobacteriales bacterium]|nr:dihydroorotase [Flavobacteriales bacterium]